MGKILVGFLVATALCATLSAAPAADAEKVEIKGTIVKTAADAVTIKDAKQDNDVAVTRETKVTVDGSPGTLASLKAGMKATAVCTKTAAGKCTAVSIAALKATE